MYGNNSLSRGYRDSREAPNYISRKEQPPISLYFIRDDNHLPPHKLSCLYCKRTIMDDVKGTIDKVVDGPLPAEDHDYASNIQCKLCGQKYRVLAGVGVPAPVPETRAAE